MTDYRINKNSSGDYVIQEKVVGVSVSSSTIVTDNGLVGILVIINQ